MKKLFILLVAFLATNCQPSKPNLEAEAAAIKAQAVSYQENATAGKFDVVKTLYAPDAIIMAPGMATVQGKDVAAFVDGFAQLKNFKVTFSEPVVSVDPGGDTGYSIASATLSYDIADGRTDTEIARDVHIWKKQADGSWKLAIDTWNETEAGIEGVFEYLPPLKGQATARNGTFNYVFGPSDGKGTINAMTGTYTFGPDNVIQDFIKYSNNPKQVGTTLLYRVKSRSGDTLTYEMLDAKKTVTGTGRAVRISN